MQYRYHEDSVVCLLNDLVHRERRYTVKDFAAAAEVHRSLANGWLTGKPAPLAKHIQPLTRNLNDPVLLERLAQGTAFAIVPRRVLSLPGVATILVGYFAAQHKITSSVAFRKLMEGKRMSREEAKALRQAIREEQHALAQLTQLLDDLEEQEQGQEGEEE
jgi:hypothetical protein